MMEIGDDGRHRQPGVCQLAYGVGERLKPPLPRWG
jgi:hypothetical protein